MRVAHKMRGFIATLLAVVMVGTFAACGGGKTQAEPKPDLDTNVQQMERPTFDLQNKVKEAKKKNPDVVGWLKIPNTKIDEAVAQTKNNSDYLRLDLDKKWNYFGSYFMDFEDTVGSSKELKKNNIIYGHNVYNGVKNPTFWQGHNIPDYGVDKVPLDYNEGEKFSQLFKYLDEDFAQKNPYIYYATEDEEMVWEVFASFYTDTTFPYNKVNNLSDAEYQKIIDECMAKSTIDYGVKVDKNDKVLHLQACSYIEGPHTEGIRYIVSAKLVSKTEKLKKTSQAKPNKDKIDYRSRLA